MPVTGTGRPVLDEPPEEVQRLFTERWQAGGGMPLLGAYTDLLVSRDANEVVAEFMRDRIRETVTDPEVAELLCPRGLPGGRQAAVPERRLLRDVQRGQRDAGGHQVGADRVGLPRRA